MQTRAEFAAYIEIDDFVVTGDGGTARVIHFDDSGDHIVLTVENEDGDRHDMVHGPFEALTLVESFLNGDETDGEEIFIDL